MQSIRTLGSLVAGLLLAQAAHAQPSTRPSAAPSTAPAAPAPPTPAAAPGPAPAAAPYTAPAPAPAPAPAVPQAAAAAPPSAPPSDDRDDEAPAAAAPPGQAQPQPPGQTIAPGPAPGSLGVGAMYATPVPVWLGTEDGETPMVEIYPDWGTAASGPPLARCRLPCGFQMQRGRYRIRVLETPDTLDGERPVAIDGASRLVITPRDRAKRTTGLVLGIGGAIAVVAGIALMVDAESQASESCHQSNCAYVWNTESTTGGLLFLAGAIMTPIGWVMFGKSGRPAIDVEPTGQAARPARYIGFVGLPGGGGLGAKFAF